MMIIPIYPDLESFAERFWSKVDKTGDCWIWKASCFKHPRKRWEESYGCFHVGSRKKKDRRMQYAHVVSYYLCNGKIPDNVKVLHKCDNTKCVNPDHLYLGTQQDNINDMIFKDRQWWANCPLPDIN